MSADTDPNSKTDNLANEDCRPVTCSQLVFQRRWYDAQWKRWSEWEELDGCNLLKYGDTPEEWKRSAESYIEMGATYEYRIIERTEKITWSVSYSANSKDREPS